jgi:hypothetical protein
MAYFRKQRKFPVSLHAHSTQEPVCVVCSPPPHDVWQTYAVGDEVWP